MFANPAVPTVTWKPKKGNKTSRLRRSRNWTSVTPYLMPWHSKRNWHSTRNFGRTEQIQREVVRRGGNPVRDGMDDGRSWRRAPVFPGILTRWCLRGEPLPLDCRPGALVLRSRRKLRLAIPVPRCRETFAGAASLHLITCGYRIDSAPYARIAARQP